MTNQTSRNPPDRSGLERRELIRIGYNPDPELDPDLYSSFLMDSGLDPTKFELYSGLDLVFCGAYILIRSWLLRFLIRSWVTWRLYPDQILGVVVF
jgi:hypothetical protein